MSVIRAGRNDINLPRKQEMNVIVVSAAIEPNRTTICIERVPYRIDSNAVLNMDLSPNSLKNTRANASNAGPRIGTVRAAATTAPIRAPCGAAAHAMERDTPLRRSAAQQRSRPTVRRNTFHKRMITARLELSLPAKAPKCCFFCRVFASFICKLHVALAPSSESFVTGFKR